MSLRRAFLVVLLPLVALLAPAHAEDEAAPGDWRAAARAEGLVEAEIAQLARDKVLVGSNQASQIFSPYLGCRLPIFLTSDSILNAFHVVLEASLVEMESGRAEGMARHVAFLVRAIPGVPEASGMELSPELLERATKRSLTTLGVALALLEAPLDDLPADVRTTVVEEAARVRKAEGVSKPAWLGPPDETFTAIDYTRFTPRGFYDRKPELQRYFRAVSWLQAIPFRVGVDEELLAALLIARALKDTSSQSAHMAAWACQNFLKGSTRLWGPSDDAGITTGGSWTTPFDAEALGEKKQWLLELAKEALISDQVAFGPLGPSMRILPASRLPDAVLFHRTTNEIEGRALPTGLEVAAALGSPVAREQLAEVAGGTVIEQIERTHPLFAEPGLYPSYLRALGTLVGEPEPDAPALFATRPWQVKSCQTLLSAWAQMRHAYVLHAKQSAHYLGLTQQEPGFIEPVPAFYRALRDVAIEAAEVLRTNGAFNSSRARGSLASDLRHAANLLDVIDAATIGDRYPWSLLGEEDEMRAMRAYEVVYACGAFEEFPDTWDEDALQRLITALRSSAAKLDDRSTPVSERMQDVLKAMTLNLRGTWEALREVLVQMELLSHKQLRRIAFDASDHVFIESYGQTLAGLMFYGGNLWLTPRDDAPRIIDVTSDPRTGGFLLVGTDRPRVLYVLYPWKDEEVLCRGAVMPYHELVDTARLTDVAWRARLDAARPAPPPG